ALAAAPLDPVVGQLAALAEAFLGNHQQGRVAPDHHHADQRVAGLQLDAFDAGGGAAHLAHVAFLEADAHAALGGQHDVVVAVGDLHVDQLVGILDVDRVDPVAARVPVGGEHRLLHGAVAG